MKSNVLVTASGGIVAQGIIKSLKFANKRRKSEKKYHIIAADTSTKAAGLYRADQGVLIPHVTSVNYLNFIIKTCNEKKIKAIFIGSDEELLPLTLAKLEIEKKTDAIVITNPLEVISKASDKWKTFKFLKNNNFPCAASSLLQNQDTFIKEHKFPMIVKPREGHGSLHFYRVNNKKELKNAVGAIQNVGWRPLLQEFLPDDNAEFTTGVTVDQNGALMSSISINKFLKSGQTYKAFIDNYETVRRSAELIAKKIGCRGPINIQARMHRGRPKVFEINARFSATCPLRTVAGINEPDILFRNMVLGENISIKEYKKLVCMRYWNEVYVSHNTYKKINRDKVIRNSGSVIPDYF